MKRERHNDDRKEDRLSDLSECVLLHILSFLSAKQAVQTCILSKRWNNLWKLLPTLRLSSSNFDTQDGFTQFTTKILSLRDYSTAHYLRFCSKDMVDSQLLECILNCAVSQNLQRLLISLLYYNIHIPACIFSCHTLTSLKLYVRHPNVTTLFPNSLNLPALTHLSLLCFVFRSGNDGRAEPFSALKKLNILSIRFCKVLDVDNLSISSATLTNLTIQTKQGRNYSKIELSTPNLSTFAYGGTPFEKICGSHLCSVKHVNIDAYMRVNNAEPPSNLLSWLKEFTEIKSLTVTSTTLEVLSLVPNLLKVKFHSLCNLETLRVKKVGISSASYDSMVHGKFVPLSVKCQNEFAKFREAIFKEGSPAIPDDDIVVFLLQNSPSAKKVHIIN
ncbi:putative F-box/FBD/LRR-repeat protein At1g78760 [Trifolium pratense]|uniref:putative F-box/FBD/LRR-repeat protein At1g78760 n=1 Tax=Trifolium pratense TaxID=57577 RepID=UPI001E69387A|nr:putative F-box/FBD/LRR-repeat protein At1g78760 [Trifolium pratense]